MLFVCHYPHPGGKSVHFLDDEGNKHLFTCNTVQSYFCSVWFNFPFVRLQLLLDPDGSGPRNVFCPCPQKPPLCVDLRFLILVTRRSLTLVFCFTCRGKGTRSPRGAGSPWLRWSLLLSAIRSSHGASLVLFSSLPSEQGRLVS